MLKDKLSLVPNQPGCYLMKNSDNVIIYVGKAKKLKNRLNSYFHSSHTGKTAKLVSEIADFEYIIVSSETESLILEINLIKKYDPKYNILLKDDKSYPYIELTCEKVPKLVVVRNVLKKKNHQYLYGPYPNVTAARKTVNLLNRIYPLRKCLTYEKKPCLYYHINQCLGYCTNNINEQIIMNMKNDIIKFLKGDHKKVTDKISEEMNCESRKMNYEKAMELKQLLDYINITLTKQKMETNDNINRDVFGYYSNNGYLSIQILFIRNGKIVERHAKILPLIDNEEEQFTSYIAKFYERILLPQEILVPQIVDHVLLGNYLKIKVKKPLRGIKLKIVEMANNNAKVALNEQFNLIKRDEEKTNGANKKLQDILKLKKLDRIELFDNSNIFGDFNVSGMVVFKNGLPAKNEYRKYKITINKNDDYQTMKEVIYRRYFKVLKEKLPRPDLIIVDGGIGQINIARGVLKELNVNIMVVGLKKDNRHMTSSLLAYDPIVPIMIDKKSDLFYYLERMQDEVHNFTINYHRNIRSKGALASVLDNVDGIGPARKKELLIKFKNINNLKEANKESLRKIIPEKVLQNLMEFLKNYE